MVSAEFLDNAYLHLKNIRKRLIQIITVVAIFTLPSFYFSPEVMRHFITRYAGRVIYTSPVEGFMVQLKIALLMGVIVSSPLVILQVVKILKEYLPAELHKGLGIYGLESMLFFLGGVFFAYKIMIPLSLRFLLMFQSQELQPLLTAAKYFSFITTLVLIFGLIFQMPVVFHLLAKMKLISSAYLCQNRKNVFLVLLIVAGFLTPPDVLSQILMCVPLYGLFELSILIVKLSGQ